MKTSEQFRERRLGPKRQPSPRRPPPQYVFITRPACPQCGGTKLRARHTMPADEDGAVVRYTRCQACSLAFVLVIENGPPPQKKF